MSFDARPPSFSIFELKIAYSATLRKLTVAHTSFILV